MSQYNDLKGKHVLIIGASGDIGISICEKYLNENCIVYATYNQDASTLELIKLMHENKIDLHIFQCDISCSENIASLVTLIKAKTNSIDILVNNAGISLDNPFSNLTNDEFDAVIKVNLYGVFYIIKQMFSLLKQAKQSVVVNVASSAGVASSSGQANFSAASGGIISLTRALALELAPQGIRVNAVAPGIIESRKASKIPKNTLKNIVAAVPLKRLGKVHEVANCVIFLSSEASSYIVGQTLIIDGGLVMR